MSLRFCLAGAAAAALVYATARDAAAFCRSTTCRSTATHECQTDQNGCPAEGAPLFWTTSCVSFAMNRLGTQDLDPNDTHTVIQKAFQAWTDVPCGDKGADGPASMTFQDRGLVDCKKSEYNKTGPNVNVVLFQDDNWTYHGIDGTLAKTSVTYNDQTGEIYDSDIEVNAANNTLTITDDPHKVEYDLQAILTHEAGHFIGIAHSPDGNAVMYASYSPGSVSQRTLTPDDVGAVCAIYPPNNGVVCNTEPRGGFSGTCDGTTTSKGLCEVGAGAASAGTSAAGAALIAMGMLAGIRRRYRGAARSVGSA